MHGTPAIEILALTQTMNSPVHDLQHDLSAASYRPLKTGPSGFLHPADWFPLL